MKYDPNKHHRHSIRLKGYDYTQPGAYFVPICTWQRECLFGDIANQRIQLSRFGETVQYNWDYLPNRHPHIQLDTFVIMPNHVHGIIILTDEPVFSPKRHGLPEIIRGLKTCSARRINQLRSLKYVPVWQRNYYKHIIRTEDTWQKIREYILNNPIAWDRDELHPGNPFPFSRKICINLGDRTQILMDLRSE